MPVLRGWAIGVSGATDRRRGGPDRASDVGFPGQSDHPHQQAVNAVGVDTEFESFATR